MLTVLAAFMTISVPVYVDGDGYMRFVREGRTVYSKQTTLTVVDEKLVSSDGPVLNPRIQVPGAPDSLRVELDGRVVAQYAGKDVELGKLVLAVFPDDVRPVVDRGFLVSSYRPSIVDAGAETAGMVRTGKPGEATAEVTVYAPETLAESSVVEIQMRASAEVEGKSFLLGDIAEVVADEATKARLSSLEVSVAPALGVAYRMTQEQVRLRLLRYSKDAEKYKFTGSPQVTVTRKGQDVTQEMFVSAAVRGAQEKLGADVPLACDATGPVFVAPLGKLELFAEQVTVDGPRVAVRVAVVVDGERINSRTLVLDKSDPVSKMRVGANVKVIVKSNLATVETTGRVRTIDAANNIVVVETATGAELTGKAVALNTVEVKL